MLGSIISLGPTVRAWNDPEYNWDDDDCRIRIFATETARLGEHFSPYDILDTLADIFDTCDTRLGYGGVSDLLRARVLDDTWRIRVIGRSLRNEGKGEDTCPLEGSDLQVL